MEGTATAPAQPAPASAAVSPSPPTIPPQGTSPVAPAAPVPGQFVKTKQKSSLLATVLILSIVGCAGVAGWVFFKAYFSETEPILVEVAPLDTTPEAMAPSLSGDASSLPSSTPLDSETTDELVEVEPEAIVTNDIQEESTMPQSSPLEAAGSNELDEGPTLSSQEPLEDERGTLIPFAVASTVNPSAEETSNLASSATEPLADPMAESTPTDETTEKTLSSTPAEQSAENATVELPTAGVSTPIVGNLAAESLLEEIATTEDPSPSLFLKAAETLAQSGSLDEATTTIRDGLQHHPTDADLHVGLADLTARASSPDEAWMQLARSGRLSEKTFARALMRYGVETGKQDETLVLLSTVTPSDSAWGSEEWRGVIRLHESGGDLPSASAIAKQHLKGDPEIHRIEALMYQQEGNLGAAIIAQSSYLTSAIAPKAEAWQFLAELYRKEGNTAQAERAEQMAELSASE